MNWEWTAFDNPAGVDMRIPYIDPSTLLGLGYYRSTGLAKGQWADYRKAMPDGRGLHVRLFRDYATVHWDRVDPSVSVVGHLIRDAPVETLLGAVAVVGLLGALSG